MKGVNNNNDVRLRAGVKKHTDATVEFMFKNSKILVSDQSHFFVVDDFETFEDSEYFDDADNFEDSNNSDYSEWV